MHSKILLGLGLLILASAPSSALAEAAEHSEIPIYLNTAPAQILRETREAIKCELPELRQAWLQAAAPRSLPSTSSQLAQSCPRPHA